MPSAVSNGRLGITTALAAAAFLLAGCDVLRPNRSLGETLWRERCADCHGLDGRGNTPRMMGNYQADLLDDSWSHGADPGAWEVVIKEGIFGDMPANPDLDEKQVKALVEYLKHLRGDSTRS